MAIVTEAVDAAYTKVGDRLYVICLAQVIRRSSNARGGILESLRGGIAVPRTVES